MQLSKLSLGALLFASFSAAITLEDAIAARDIVLAKAAGEAIQKRNLEIRTPKKKVKSSGGGGDEGEEEDDSAAVSVHINMALVTGAGAVAVAAMML